MLLEGSRSAGFLTGESVQRFLPLAGVREAFPLRVCGESMETRTPQRKLSGICVSGEVSGNSF